ncbi:hypothetical protein [Promicromonospora aerolata]|uniref:Uncharacterized protein n=1 Tax=Promicromonospora aerolata TaxID=195749 RepID=A0ABW4VBK3_9MICO
MQNYKSIVYKMVAVLLLTVMGATTAGAAAHAVPESDPILEESPSTPVAPVARPGQVTYEDYRVLFDTLDHSDATRTEEVIDGVRVVTFTIDDSSLTLADVNESEYSTQISVGMGFYGPYVQFNQTDQRALIAGGTAAIVIGICAISAGTACGVAGVIVSAATVYLTENGTCSNGRHLRVYLASGRIPRKGCVNA